MTSRSSRNEIEAGAFAHMMVMMLLIFQTIFSWATVPMDLIDGSFGALQEWTRGRLPDGLLASLVAASKCAAKVDDK